MKLTFSYNLTDSISADIKLETENEEGICGEDAPTCLSESVYHPRVALKNAINEWLPEFYVNKEAWGPITKPHPIQTSSLKRDNCSRRNRISINCVLCLFRT